MLGFPLRLCAVMGSRFALGRGRFRRETRADRLIAPPELPEKSGIRRFREEENISTRFLRSPDGLVLLKLHLDKTWVDRRTPRAF